MLSKLTVLTNQSHGTIRACPATDNVRRRILDATRPFTSSNRRNGSSSCRRSSSILWKQQTPTAKTAEEILKLRRRRSLTAALEGGVIRRLARDQHHHSIIRTSRRDGAGLRRTFSNHKQQQQQQQGGGESTTTGVVKGVGGATTTTTTITSCEGLGNLIQTHGSLSRWTQRLTASEREQLLHVLRGGETASSSSSSAAAASTTAAAVPEPSRRDLQLVALNIGIPFVGFGIMDNSILILAGDAIDTSLGVVLGISTMCAAAIGNIVSDVAGLTLGSVIEDYCAKIGMPVPNLTTAQRQLRSVRFTSQLGCAVGVIIGCIIGMFPLLFIDSNRVQARKREAHLDTIFRDVVTEAGSLVGAARTCLYLLVNPHNNDDDKDKDTSPMPVADGKFLYNKYDDKAAAYKGTSGKERWIPLGRGIISRAILTGESWNIADVTTEPDFVPDIGYIDPAVPLSSNANTPYSMLCVPVMDSSGRPIAVIQAINKVGKGRDDESTSADTTTGPMTTTTSKPEPRSFTEGDVQILKALASHVSVSLQRMYEQADGDDAEMRLTDTIRMLKKYGLAGLEDEKNPPPHPTARTKLARRPLFPEDQ